MEREMAGLAELAAGRRDQAIAALQQAVELEHAMAPPVGMPQPPKPAHELLGELLLEADRPREAAATFAMALERSPNRTLSVLGLARARARLGETAEARKHYEALLVSWDKADPDLVEIREAREFLAGRAVSSPGTGGGPAAAGGPGWLVVAGVALAGLIVAALLARSRSAAARTEAAARTRASQAKGRRDRKRR
jgi:tetratricopeptide (TPR) repeat protein